uniref:Uncharacterized protein n=1 Tax=Timema douglasi TaxID=61478 RepID=A0A7R8VH53_TIMDO|nr:unnamed protein product [Timema douglasi]
MAKASLARDVAAVARGETLSCLWEGVDRFERYFLPFCHYPLRKAVVSTVTHIYKVLCKEARLLTKLAIMVAEEIYFKECSSGGRCHTARITLVYALECLLPKMKCFLEGTPYNLLDAVLREGWFEYEQDDGECVTIPSDVFSFIDLEGVCVPNVDDQFISNFSDFVNESDSDITSDNDNLPDLRNPAVHNMSDSDENDMDDENYREIL